VDTNSQHDKYAIKLSVWYNYVRDAALQVASINYKPAALKGFYKYEENVIINGGDEVVDTAQVIVMLSKWNKTTLKRDTVGLGILNINKVSHVFKEFNVAINYTSTEAPDTIAIFLDPTLVGRSTKAPYQHSGSGVCSYFTVDNLSLVTGNTTGITDIAQQHTITVYPNPTADILTFEPISGALNIFDLAGKSVFALTLKDTRSIDVAFLPKGIYFMAITNDAGKFKSKFVKQ
jgi:hypothetical protein